MKCLCRAVVVLCFISVTSAGLRCASVFVRVFVSKDGGGGGGVEGEWRTGFVSHSLSHCYLAAGGRVSDFRNKNNAVENVKSHSSVCVCTCVSSFFRAKHYSEISVFAHTFFGHEHFRTQLSAY